MKTLVGLATIETGSMPALREENALAVLANLSVEDEVIVSNIRPAPLHEIHMHFIPNSARHGRGMTISEFPNL